MAKPAAYRMVLLTARNEPSLDDTMPPLPVHLWVTAVVGSDISCATAQAASGAWATDQLIPLIVLPSATACSVRNVSIAMVDDPPPNSTCGLVNELLNTAAVPLTTWTPRTSPGGT